MTAQRTIVPALILVGALSAACSSSGSTAGTPVSAPPSTTSSPSTPGPTSSSSTASGAAPTTAQLKAILVQSSDLPSGWTGKPGQAETKADKGTDAELAACVGTSDTSDRDQIQQVPGDDFSMGQSTISSDATTYKSESDVQNQVALLRNPKAQTCLNTLFKQQIAASLPSGATIRNIGIKLDTDASGNLAGFANGAVVVSANSQTIRVYLGAAFFTGPQLTGEVTFTSVGTPIKSSFANPIVEAVATRAANA